MARGGPKQILDHAGSIRGRPWPSLTGHRKRKGVSQVSAQSSGPKSPPGPGPGPQARAPSQEGPEIRTPNRGARGPWPGGPAPGPRAARAQAWGPPPRARARVPGPRARPLASTSTDPRSIRSQMFWHVYKNRNSGAGAGAGGGGEGPPKDGTCKLVLSNIEINPEIRTYPFEPNYSFKKEFAPSGPLAPRPLGLLGPDSSDPSQHVFAIRSLGWMVQDFANQEYKVIRSEY